MPRAKKRATHTLEAIKGHLTEYYNVDCRLLAYKGRMQPQGGLPGKIAFYEGQQAKRIHERKVRHDLIAFLRRGERSNVLTSEHWQGFRDLAFQFDKFRLPQRREHLMKRMRGKLYGHDETYIGRAPLAKGADSHNYKMDTGAPMPSDAELRMARVNHDHKVSVRYSNRIRAEVKAALNRNTLALIIKGIQIALTATGQPGTLRLQPGNRLPVVMPIRIVKK